MFQSNSSTLTGKGPATLSRIAHIPRNIVFLFQKLNNGCLGDREVSNSDQLFFSASAIMPLEMSTSSLSFRSSELSQPSEVFSS
jgi:hypothetical protein